MAASAHADIQGWVLRFAALVPVVFFVATGILPLDTVGDPANDIPLLRIRWYFEWLVVAFQGGLVLALIWRLARRPAWAVALALATSIMALVLILAEEGLVIQNDSLIRSHYAAMFLLNINRFCTAALSIVAFLTLWRIDARH